MGFEQLNEIMAQPVPPPLPAGQKAVVGDDYLLWHFIGPSADYYTAIFNAERRQRRGKPIGGLWSWNWPAFLIFLPWALYRKMWLFGGIMTLIAVALALLFPPIALVTSFAVAVVTGIISNGAYLRLATRKIAKLKATSSSDEELLARIHKAGGVSQFGAWFGAIVVVLANVVSVISAITTTLNPH
jgi:hypothetical protein